MNMLYYADMGKSFEGYKITEKDIENTLQYLITSVNKETSREDAIKYLEEKHSIAHVAAHKIVEDERSGKIKQLKVKKIGK